MPEPYKLCILLIDLLLYIKNKYIVFPPLLDNTYEINIDRIFSLFRKCQQEQPGLHCYLKKSVLQFSYDGGIDDDFSTFCDPGAADMMARLPFQETRTHQMVKS